MVKNSAALLFFRLRSYIYLTSSLSTFSVGLSRRPAFREQVISGWRAKTEITHFLTEENASSQRVASAFASRLFRLESESVIAKRSGSTSVAHPYPIQWGNLQVTNPLKIMLQTKPGSIFPEICPTGSGSGT